MGDFTEEGYDLNQCRTQQQLKKYN